MEPREAVLSLWWEWNGGLPVCFGSHFADYLAELLDTEYEALALKAIASLETSEFECALEALYQATGLTTEDSRRAAALELAESQGGIWHVGCHGATVAAIRMSTIQ